MGKMNQDYYLNNQLVQMTKGYTNPISGGEPIFTADLFDYIEHYYNTHHSALKYKNEEQMKERYGDASQQDCKFYLNQARMYYLAAKKEPFEVSMLTSYYCMLNLAKSYLSFKSEYADDFVRDFTRHGIKEDYESTGKSFDKISIRYDTPQLNRNNKPINQYGGVFPMLAKTLDANLEEEWSPREGKNLKTLMYNLPFVQSAYRNTYGSTKNRIEDLFIPLSKATAPYYFQPKKTSLKLRAKIDLGYLEAENKKCPEDVIQTISKDLVFSNDGCFESVASAKRNPNDSISSELKNMNTNLRKSFVYIGGNNPQWYIKRTELGNKEVLNISTITINMAIMHRLSEIARYKPDQLYRLMNNNESWLLQEYMNAALDQFVDEMASEITNRNVILSKW